MNWCIRHCLNVETVTRAVYQPFNLPRYQDFALLSPPYNLARIRLFLNPLLLSHHHPPVLMAISSVTTSKCPTIVTMFEPFGGSGARWSCDEKETQVASDIIIVACYFVH
jgi:hypothetical protein